MEVEDLIEDDKSEKIADAGQIVGCVPTEGALFGKPHLEISNGCLFFHFPTFFCYYNYSEFPPRYRTY